MFDAALTLGFGEGPLDWAGLCDTPVAPSPSSAALVAAESNSSFKRLPS